jgi:fused signal recognition particle receptor
VLGLKKLRDGLSKTRRSFFGRIRGLVTGKLDEASLEELEELLIAGDVGVDTSIALIETLRERQQTGGLNNGESTLDVLKSEMVRLLETADENGQDAAAGTGPHVILMIGINGVGKTTSIAKLAQLQLDADRTVLLAAADTYRAAAVEQLSIWAERLGVDIVRSQMGSDPAAVAFDAVKAAQSRKIDTAIIDTAGRLHTKVNLLEELKKIVRVMQKLDSTAPHETLLVLDANIGQNSISQAREFVKAVPVTGVVLTKLDGTARGGIALAVSRELGLPVRYLGVGEGMDDLEEFAAEPFVDALFMDDEEFGEQA